MLNNFSNTEKDSSKYNKEIFSYRKNSADLKEAVRKIRLYLGQISDRFDVVLYKSSRGFGLTLVDEVVLNTVTLLKVRNVQHAFICTAQSMKSKSVESDQSQSTTTTATCHGCSAALVQPGDVLSGFNKSDIVGLKPEQVVKLFREVKVGEPALLTLWKISDQPRLLYVPDNDYEIINFYLQKGESGFGFILGNCKDDHQVAKVNGTGDVQILLNPGDHLVGIGRVRIDHLSHDQVVSLLKKFPIGRFLQFTIKRGNKSESLSSIHHHNRMTTSYCCDHYGTLPILPNYLTATNTPFSLNTVAMQPTSGPCNTPDFVPATHYLQQYHQINTPIQRGYPTTTTTTIPNNNPATTTLLNYTSSIDGGDYSSIIRHLPTSHSLPINNLVDIVNSQINTCDVTMDTVHKSPSLPTHNIHMIHPPDCIPIISSNQSVKTTCQIPIGYSNCLQSFQSNTLPKLREVKEPCVINSNDGNISGHVRCQSVGPELTGKQPPISSESSFEPSSSDSSSDRGESSFTVRIIRSQSRGFGFRLMGGSEEGCQAYVGDIITDGPVEKCGKIRRGDIILKINGTKTKGLTHSQVVKLLEKAGKEKNLLTGTIGELEMSLIHSNIEYQEKYIILDLKNENDNLTNRLNIETTDINDEMHSNSAGIVLVAAVGGTKEPCGVGKIVPQSVAEKSGLQVGDRVLGIDGQGVVGIPLKKVMKLLRERVAIAITKKRDDDDNNGETEPKCQVVLKIRPSGGNGLRGLKTIRYDLPPSTDDDSSSQTTSFMKDQISSDDANNYETINYQQLNLENKKQTESDLSNSSTLNNTETQNLSLSSS